MLASPLLRFYLIAFGLAWLGWLPAALGSRGVAPFTAPGWQVLLILPAVAPALAAGWVMRASYGPDRANALFAALLQWRVVPIWYLAAVGGPVVIVGLTKALATLLDWPDELPAPQGERVAVAIAALISSLLANPWEEVGWRGFALPHWQQRYPALAATVIVGGLWGLWHLPIFFWIGNPMANYPFFPWLAGTIAGAVIYTWLYNSAAGSLLPVTLFHVAFNTAVTVIGGSIAALAVAQILIALVIIIATGPAQLARRERVRWQG
ncbi:CPBP family intramembrane glutamic endopeptidase [Chloroflexus sp.]|uniref:CPBP family intramembrane glutamic endopeptidase n=1 Tax=Chloroflexus sp. TaxID=1904827 RepID=UPI002ACE5EE8|nr:CPBP family intramembrane glutamic endopeptidase [Chloroflexus sp.]